MKIPAITDAHVHLRQDELCRQVKGYTDRVCDHCIAMPNTEPAITNESTIKRFQDEYAMSNCEVHLTCKLLPSTTTKEIEEAKKLGVLGYKIYPCGVTTNSDDGISQKWLRELGYDFITLLDAINANDLVLMHHGEVPSSSVFQREVDYCPIFHSIVTRYPKMRNVFEHISTSAALMEVGRLVNWGCKVFGTITLHHLIMTIDDVIGSKLNCHNFCKPILKSEYDQGILRDAARSKEWVGLGSDSAPHWLVDKRSGAAGVFSAPVLLQALVEYGFNNSEFLFSNANNFYKFDSPKRQIELIEEPWLVESVSEQRLIPFLHQKTLKYKVE